MVPNPLKPWLPRIEKTAERISTSLDETVDLRGYSHLIEQLVTQKWRIRNDN
jgi:hypothetical protein